MKKLTTKRKNYLRRRSKTELKKKKRDRQFRLNKIGTNSYLNQLSFQRKNIAKENKKPGSTIINLSPANTFSILESPNKVIAFIFRLKSYAKPNFSGYQLFIDLANVIQIDIGAISLLLSAVEELAQYKIRVTGNIPDNKNCNEIFIESGYLAHMNSLSSNLLKLQNNTKNSIIKKGRDTTRNSEVGKSIQSAMEMLTGTKKHYQPVYSIVQEISGNSVEHAYQRNSREHWVFSVNHNESENKIIFTFADNGSGILKTLRRKLTQQFFDGLGLKNDAAILNGAYLKNYESRHIGQINRNKGLPLLRRIQENNEVKNLFVLTNRVLLFLDSKKSISINRNFSGTFYYWELDLDCIQNGTN
ncbi:ATP-binding protein [Ekhidna sp.]|uniref:ATP-binding protein n=1 Tax=Ekhidna sp. TaxID=2608089 RepID=UPI00329A7304